MAGRSGKPPKPLRLATGRQLYRISQQGCLRLAVDADTFAPGRPVDVSPILHGEAAATLDRLRAERWAGLGRFPEAGEAWAVRDGLVVPLGKETP